MNDTMPTPRTDNEIIAHLDRGLAEDYLARLNLMIPYARRLERELAEKHEEMCVLKSQVENNDAMLEQTKMNARSMWKTKLESAESRIGALEKELSELRSATSWRPIDTAPKDGRDIIACRIGYFPQTVRWVTWSGESRWCIDPECLGEQFNEHWETTTYEPTHWMPLPQPPTF